MTRLFEAALEDIKQLNDSQLTDLLRRLLHLEAARFGIAARGIHIALNIDVPDGGEDGRIQWKRGPKSTDYLPSRLTMFQCKARDMRPPDCGKELRRKYSVKLKPQVEEVLDAKGCYILFTTQLLDKKQINDRIPKMRQTIRSAGKSYADSAALYIYDANKIRDWTNRYIPAITAVSLWCGRPLLSGMQTWEHWSGFDEYRRFPFVRSDFINEYLAQLRQDLAEPRRVARIIGLSGLGKTRLALEAFRPAVQRQESHLDLHHRVVYLDAGSNTSDLAATVSDWCSHGLEGVLVVDNCDLQLHQQLQANVQHTHSRLSLLTLDYNPDERSDTPTIRIDRSSDSVIQEILKEVYVHLPAGELDRIAQFAQGFPQMAVLLAKARLHEEREMGNLRDDVLLKKLLWGRGQVNDEAKKVIAACALFEHIGFTAEREEEYLFVAKHVARIDADDFYSHVKDFQRRGVIDERGRYIRVVPLPLVVRLAADWWQRCSPTRARQLITMEMPGGLAEALCDRVAMLDFLPTARELVEDLCGERSPFGQVEVLQSEQGARLFRSLVGVNPEAAARALERVFVNRSREELLQIRAAARRDIIGALEKLAFRQQTFHLAARLLLAFAAAETEHWSNNATGVFQQLFRIYLSGTEAPPAERLIIIDEALATPDVHRHTIAVQALHRALQTYSFARMGGAESQGSGPALQDWRPRTQTDWQQMCHYLDEILQRLNDIAVGSGKLAELARDAIADHIRELVRFGRMEALGRAITTIVERKGSYWPKALEQVRHTIRYDVVGIPQTTLQQLHVWEGLLQPDSLPERLRLIVSAPPWRDIERDQHNRYVNRAEERARTLAEECADDFQAWSEQLPIVLQGEQRQGVAFGRRLGQCMEDPQFFIDEALKILARLDRGKANPIVLAAFLGSIRANQPELVEHTLDTVANDQALASYLVELTRLVRPTLADLSRVVHLVKVGRIPVGALKGFSYGSVLDHWSPQDFIDFTDELLTHGTPGGWVALEILSLHRYDESAGWAAHKSLFRKIFMHPALNFVEPPDSTSTDIASWQDVAMKLLEEGDDDLARDILQKMLAVCTNERFHFEFENAFKPLLSILLSRYTDVAWPMLSGALLSNTMGMIPALSDLLRPGMENEKQGQEPGTLSVLPEDLLLQWCQEHPTTAPSVLIRVIQLLQREGEQWTWTPLARAVIDQYGEDPAVLSALASNLGVYAWSGSLVPYCAKRVKPLEELGTHHLPEVRRWAVEQLRYLQQQIDRENTRDAEGELGIY